ncbi:MAG: PD40 domain-containing protein [Bacteroidales bacterium]|nr:PD40 domain-containing protein [Bacteroidales bacterium]
MRKTSPFGVRIEHCILVFLSVILLVSVCCNPKTRKPNPEFFYSELQASGVAGNLEITYPLDETLFPPEIVSPTIHWKDETKEADTWIVIIEAEGIGKPIFHFSDQAFWQPGPSQWEEIKNHSIEETARITVMGFNQENPENVLSGADIRIRTSTDEVGAQIFYRDVTLPFGYAIKHCETIRWRLGDISCEKESRVVLKNLFVCGNCHSFTPDGKTLAMDVDYANDKGSYVIAPFAEGTILSTDNIITWSDYRTEDREKTYGLLSQISPCGRYVVSTVKDLSVFVPRDESLMYSQLFFPLKGILVIYDTFTREFRALPGADDQKYVQSNANWSPDGKYIVFARAKAIHSDESGNTGSGIVDSTKAYNLLHAFFNRTRLVKFDLYRIPFNEGKGGKAEPLEGASNNNMSNYFARYSPDGKWIVFCQAESFMLLMPDSKLYIMPAEGETPREMTCNTTNMNSWHSWSPNGRWLVFSSKKRGAYTDLYLTHIDENGNDTPPVLLEKLSIENRACNIPEFVNIAPGKEINLIAQFQDDPFHLIPVSLKKVRDGEFVGSSYYGNNRATVAITIRNKRIIHIEVMEFVSENPDDPGKIIKKVIERQSIADEFVEQDKDSSRVLLKAIEKALRKGIVS